MSEDEWNKLKGREHYHMYCLLNNRINQLQTKVEAITIKLQYISIEDSRTKKVDD
jgi:hypothetical protein